MIALVTTPDGGYVKDATGLYYCQNRYYDPANGRWLTRDPIGYEGSINLYGYCGGGPVGAIDPSGLVEVFGFDFTLEGIGHGIATGLAGLTSAATFGAYDGGAYSSEPGFGFSHGAGVVARECLFAAGTIGLGEALATARAARSARSLQVASAAEVAGESMGGNLAASGGVYVLEEEATGIVRYVGQTGDFMARQGQHALDPVRGGLRFRRVFGNEDLIERLVYEQQLINLNGGVGGGQLMNKINAISKSSNLFKSL